MNVFFTISASSRERMWDTVRHQPDGITALTPTGVAPRGSRATFTASRSWIGRLKVFISKALPLPNITLRTDIPDDADVIYTWSKFPLRSKKPFVIELDNPYALTYYSRPALLILRPLLKRWLKSAQHIAFMSDACRASFTDLFGKIPVPQSVSYPFMESHIATKDSKENKPIQFLFVGLDFRIKGGIELLSAWRRAHLENAELHIVSIVPDDIRSEYASDHSIIFHGAVSREELMANHFPKANVFVYPTFFDSFGVVLLEALSYGLGIIATDLYATSEIVIDSENGKLLTHPILKPRQIADRMLVSPIEEHAETFLATHLGQDMFYESLCLELINALQEATKNHTAWSAASARHFNERFAPEIWQKTMRSMLE